MLFAFSVFDERVCDKKSKAKQDSLLNVDKNGIHYEDYGSDYYTRIRDSQIICAFRSLHNLPG